MVSCTQIETHLFRSFCFCLENFFLFFLSGVLQAYKKCIRSVQLYGPTNFSPVINHVAKFAQTYKDGSQYFILLIITDGIITDMEQTKRVSFYL